MFDLFSSKTKVQSWSIHEFPIERLEILGIGQINPYCPEKYDNEVFITVVNFANDSKNYDEREGLMLTDYFTVRRCPRCKKVELIPIKMKINLDPVYLKYEEDIAFDAFEEHPSRRHYPTIVDAYCNSCSSCFEIKIKNKDLWIKEAKKIRIKDLIIPHWEEYNIN